MNKMENIKSIKEKIENFTDIEKGRLMEKMCSDFGMDVFYCELCYHVYDCDSCNITDHNEVPHEYPESVINIANILSKMHVETRAEIIQDTMSELSMTIYYCEKCKKIFSGIFCLNTDCEEDIEYELGDTWFYRVKGKCRNCEEIYIIEPMEKGREKCERCEIIMKL